MVPPESWPVKPVTLSAQLVGAAPDRTLLTPMEVSIAALEGALAVYAPMCKAFGRVELTVTVRAIIGAFLEASARRVWRTP
jgi:hypothetical protein